MEINRMTYLAAAALIVGIVLWFVSDKKRNEQQQWHSGLQWAYLLMTAGVFGLMSATSLSLTAILLLFVLFCGAVWVWHKGHLKAVAKQQAAGGEVLDNNHFRDYMGGLFPMLAVIFVVRTFIVEPFQIPSSSMRPGLTVGDFVLVNKFSYGVRVPISNAVAVPVGQIQRGDVVVFQYPWDETLTYVKRVVAVAGDEVVYRDKVLTVNGQVERDVAMGTYRYPDDQQPALINELAHFQSHLHGRDFDILQNNQSPAVVMDAWQRYRNRAKESGLNDAWTQHCVFETDGSGFRCTVPQGQYFALGDNRDHSADSRYWGFVDDRLVVGKAFFVVVNFRDFSRSFRSIH